MVSAEQGTQVPRTVPGTPLTLPPRNLSLLLSRINRGLTQAPASQSRQPDPGAGW